jgi:hypothetical protein
LRYTSPVNEIRAPLSWFASPFRGETRVRYDQ